jgi:hypothetical protein
MPDGRPGPFVVGALTAITGGMLFLAAADVIPLPDETLGGPRWLVALFALGLLFGGGYAMSLAMPTPGMTRVLGGASGLAFLTSAALLFTWLALTGGGFRRPPVVDALTRAFFWLFAIPIDALALVAWFVVVRWLARRPAP